MHKLPAFSHFAALLLVTTAMSGCASLESLFQHNPPKHHGHAKHTSSVKTAKTQETSDDFLRQLALARLGLPAEADDTSSIGTHLDALQDYCLHQPLESQRPSVIVIALKADGAPDIGQIIAPASLPALLPVMNRLATMPYHIQDIQFGTVSVAPSETFYQPDATTQEVRVTLEAQQQQLRGSFEKPSALDSAKSQLPLIRFFIAHHFRDAAYLSIDNVRHLLAEAQPQQPGDDDAIKTMSQQLDALEGQLRKAMPYTLSHH